MQAQTLTWTNYKWSVVERDLEDIVDAHATQYGLQGDDADLLEATAAELRRQEQYTAADTVAGWKRTIYAVEG